MKNRKITAICLAFALSCSMAGCSRVSEEALRPALGLQWYHTPETVKAQLSDFTLLNERESTGTAGEWQLLLDYDVTNLYDTECTLTLCFTSLGLVGLNYHDIQHEKTYQEWSLALESVYGIPTEESRGLSAWYENPLGKNTAIYLFNLEEGVQISFYTEYSGSEKATVSDNPDEIPETVADIPPMPETRTPIIPIETQPPETMADSSAETAETTRISETMNITSGISTTAVTDETSGESEHISTELPGEELPPEEEQTEPSETQASGRNRTAVSETVALSSSTTTSTVTETSASSSVTTTATTTTTAPETEPPPDDPLNDLTFYCSPEIGRRKMSGYAQLYEYRTEEPGQPWELIMEYENVDFYQTPVQSVLCFTSLGLVGVNYFDDNPANYQYWVSRLTDIYHTPTDTQYDYTAWTDSPVGNRTQIYIFALEDGVQISFFADDSGSELS